MSNAGESDKMSDLEMAQYYVEAHRRALARDQDDRLEAVIASGENRWVIRFKDFAHRLGMKKAFASLEDEMGSLRGRSVLDLGCGRGRWTREYASRGALVTGVDISPDAIQLVAREQPQYRFLCGDVASLEFADESFDIVNSVTVLQHMPDARQRTVLGRIGAWLKPGGRLVLLESLVGFGAPHVFPHSTDEWIAMAETAGLKRTSCWGSNFEVLFVMRARFIRRERLGREAFLPGAGPALPPSLIKTGLKTAVALASFPIEWCCHRAQLAAPTHGVMMFSK